MAAITIRNIEPDVKERLRVRAAKNGRSMEEEIRTILRKELRGVNGAEMLKLFRDAFGENGIDLDLPARKTTKWRDFPDFSDY